MACDSVFVTPTTSLPKHTQRKNTRAKSMKVRNMMITDTLKNLLFSLTNQLKFNSFLS